MLQRSAAALIAIAAIALAFYDAFATPQAGVFGMTVTYANGSVRAAQVQPGGPAFRAGIRDGDEIAFTTAPLEARYALTQHAQRGGAYDLAVKRNGTVRRVQLTASADQVNSRTGRFIDLEQRGSGVFPALYAGACNRSPRCLRELECRGCRAGALARQHVVDRRRIRSRPGRGSTSGRNGAANALRRFRERRTNAVYPRSVWHIRCCVIASSI